MVLTRAISNIGLGVATAAPFAAALPPVSDAVLADNTSYCALFRTTGWLCPLCGMTHALIDVADGALADATRSNALVWLYLALVVVGWLGLFRSRLTAPDWLGDRLRTPIWQARSLWLRYNFGWMLLSTIAGFTVLRNL